MENQRIQTGEVVRVMETHQKWVAELICTSANTAFESERQMRSYVIKIQ